MTSPRHQKAPSPPLSAPHSPRPRQPLSMDTARHRSPTVLPGQLMTVDHLQVMSLPQRDFILTPPSGPSTNQLPSCQTAPPVLSKLQYTGLRYRTTRRPYRTTRSPLCPLLVLSQICHGRLSVVVAKIILPCHKHCATAQTWRSACPSTRPAPSRPTASLRDRPLSAGTQRAAGTLPGCPDRDHDVRTVSLRRT